MGVSQLQNTERPASMIRRNQSLQLSPPSPRPSQGGAMASSETGPGGGKGTNTSTSQILRDQVPSRDRSPGPPPIVEERSTCFFCEPQATHVVHNSPTARLLRPASVVTLQGLQHLQQQQRRLAPAPACTSKAPSSRSFIPPSFATHHRAAETRTLPKGCKEERVRGATGPFPFIIPIWYQGGGSDSHTAVGRCSQQYTTSCIITARIDANT